MNISDFDYFLPEEQIAQVPADPRDSSRLMVLSPQKQTIEHRHFYELDEYLTDGDVLIFNDTRVIPARLIGVRQPTGGKAEVFLLRQLERDQWEVLVNPGKKMRVGSVTTFGHELSCEEILDRLGTMPLPPYIHETLQDPERYQTIYSREKGSAAAPTAGLHFTESLMDRLRKKGVHLGFVTLHVGLGTFRPVQVDEIEDHVMHSEFYSIPTETADLIRMAKQEGRRVIAVGTTSIRTLESAAVDHGMIEAKQGWTNIFIYPGYQFKIVDAVITNFHLPKSTLIMLVSAFAGREFTLKAYRTAVEENYRFFSFGDAMLIQSRA